MSLGRLSVDFNPKGWGSLRKKSWSKLKKLGKSSQIFGGLIGGRRRRGKGRTANRSKRFVEKLAKDLPGSDTGTKPLSTSCRIKKKRARRGRRNARNEFG